MCLSSEFVGEVEHQEPQISGEGGPVGLLQRVTRLECGDDAGKGVVDQTCIVEEDVHEQAKVICHCGEVRLKDLALLTYTVDAGLCDWIDKLNESCDSLANCTPGTGFQLSSEQTKSILERHHVSNTLSSVGSSRSDRSIEEG